MTKMFVICNFLSICDLSVIWSTAPRVLEMWNLKQLDLIDQELCMTAFTILVSY